MVAYLFWSVVHVVFAEYLESLVCFTHATLELLHLAIGKLAQNRALTYPLQIKA